MNEILLSTSRITVTKYAARHWAVWIGEELIAVTVYKKGAARVAELLRDFSLKLSPNFDLGIDKTGGLLQAEGSQK